MNCKHNSMEQEQAIIGGNCPICLREERDQLKAQIKAAHVRIGELEHSDQMWDETMSQFTDYEGDEAPWIVMEREFKALKQQLEAAQREKAQLQNWLIEKIKTMKGEHGYHPPTDGRDQITEIYGWMHVLCNSHEQFWRIIEERDRINRERAQLAALVACMRGALVRANNEIHEWRKDYDDDRSRHGLDLFYENNLFPKYITEALSTTPPTTLSELLKPTVVCLKTAHEKLESITHDDLRFQLLRLREDVIVERIRLEKLCGGGKQ